jgi:DNA ligase (NAD+)
MDVHKIIQDLRDELNQHNYNYYVLDNPTISDFEFDQKLKQLQELESRHPEFFDDNSPTQRVGGTITKNFQTVVHDYRMYSLDNSYSKEDVVDWENRIQKVLGNVPLQYTCELKYDGASISITYENGKLKRAVTRGDGFQGDDVTNNIKTIKSIPLQLKGNFPERFDIRGEIVLPFEGFEKMNQELIEIGETPYSNPRNTASGSLKLQDSSEVAKRPLECLLYFIVGNNLNIKTQFEGLEAARNWGFKVPKEAKLANSLNEVFDYINYWDEHRHKLPYETDGVVIKVNSFQHQDELGYTFNLGNNFLKKKQSNDFGFFFSNELDVAKKYMLVNHFDEIVGGSITSVFIKSDKILNLLDFDLKINQTSFIEGLLEKGVSFNNEYNYLENKILNFDTDEYEGWGYNIFDYFDVLSENVSNTPIL